MDSQYFPIEISNVTSIDELHPYYVHRELCNLRMEISLDKCDCIIIMITENCNRCMETTSSSTSGATIFVHILLLVRIL